MSESNNVKFVEADEKWLWKRYDAEGSVIYRSPLFNTEREAREDYEINGSSEADTSSENTASEATVPTSPEQAQDTTPEAGPNINGAGTADGEEVQQENNDNSAGTASL